LGGARLRPPMRKGLLVVGIVLLIIGAALLAVGFSSSLTTSVPAGECLNYTPTTLGSDPVTVSWSGLSSSSSVTLSSTGDCSPSTLIASGTGASGSFTATLTTGTTYGIAVSSGTGSVTVASHGFTVLELIGIVVLILGILLAVVAVVRKPKVRAAPEPQTAAQVSDAATDAGTDLYTAGPGAAALTPGARANQVCTYCGATNEAWLTNCRSCKRPLASTSQ
jgi:hypothetical protein